MPTVGGFVAVLDQQTGKLSIEDRAELQAGLVLECLQRFGSSINPEFEDRITMYLMTGRWRYSLWARHVRVDELTWWKQDFIRAYKARAAGEQAGYSCRSLVEIAQAAVKQIPVVFSPCKEM